MEGNKENLFLRETIDPHYFKLENVLSDNACFYRALANGIIYSHENNRDKKYSNDLENQTKLARELQLLAYNWIVNNKDETIIWDFDDSNLDIKVQDLVKIVHDINFSQYQELYKFFAGDPIYYKENNQIHLIPNRWGGYLEQIAISKRLRIPIIVFVLQKFNKKSNKVISGRIYNNAKIYKNTRLKIWQVSGREYIKDSSPLYLLWRKNNKDEHYMSLYQLNKDIEKDIISNIF